MNRIDRLMATVVLLQSRRLVRAEDIAAHFEISLRTVYRDIAALSEGGIPIIAEAGLGYSLVRGYHLPPVMFTTEEASALFMGGKLVEHLTDSSLRKQMELALLKIRSVLPRERQDYLDRLERSTAVSGSASHGAASRLASEALIPIQKAIAERRVLTLNYAAGKRGEISRREVEPLGLVYYMDNWHLIAYCRLRRDFRDFRTDRILDLQAKSEIFSGHTDFSLKRFIESVMRDNNLETAQVWFASEAMERVRRDWCFGLIEEQADGKGCLTTLMAHSFESMAPWVLSFGARARVVSPPRLRQLVQEEAEKVRLLYEETEAARVELETLLT